jgi:hypothetical protein
LNLRTADPQTARIVVVIDFLEWTLDNRLRHASFGALTANKPCLRGRPRIVIEICPEGGKAMGE